tara:strand:- start:53 stop:472 length:420 start_codon:yes stop_codon:yes gene_type:complete
MSRVRRRPRGAATRNRGVPSKLNVAAALKAGKVIKGKRPTKPKPNVGIRQRNKDMAKAATRPSVRPKTTVASTAKPVKRNQSIKAKGITKPTVGIKQKNKDMAKAATRPRPVKPRPPVRAKGPRSAMAAGFAGLSRKMV